ncbi:MAG TPA: M12 family metallo-peptidase [Steroidobacteraceae bacterium]|nr:M12 family metallo-peptidase [Steroidobacteraceae bacterium]
MATRYLTGICILALTLSAGSAHAAQFRILHAESIDVSGADLAIPGAPLAKPTQSMTFQAYGRQFDLELEPNERLLSELPAAERAALQRYAIYRGRLAGAPDSWVRMTRVGNGVQGMVWDGAELYFIEPARTAERLMIAPGQLGFAATAIYRLSDTQSDLQAGFCKVRVPEGASAPLAAYRSLVGELKEQAALAAVPTSQIPVALLGDFEFSSDHPGDAEAVALARMNNVDGIFSNQVGVHLALSTVRMFITASDPFTATTVPDTLLDEVGNYKATTANGIRATGLAHLMTGRNLDGTTVGIAFTSALCSANFGASLSMGGLEISSASAVLVAAHEIGHNFGAPHDAEAGSACESAPTGFLMEARINGSSTFSQCSLDQMRPEIDAAACITPLAFADGQLGAAPSAINVPVDQATSFAVTVSSVGALAIDNTLVTISIPAAITVDSAVPAAGTCSTGAGSVTCDLGSVAGGTSLRIDLTVRGTQNGSFVAAATLAASNDSNAQNNSANVSLNVGQSQSAPPSNGGGGGALGGSALLALLLASLRHSSPLTRSRPAGPSRRPAFRGASALR